jgi:ergothioneine biosynthesis protein EgtB
MDPLYALYRNVRAATERLCEPLAVEDYVVQTMSEVSPTRWHLAHTSWFFEEFALRKVPSYRIHDERYRYLFNSYYEAVGPRHPRPERGHLSRPTVAEIFAYRRHVDGWMERAFADLPRAIVELGINHEEQHQELILTDIKHVLAQNPLRPVYRAQLPSRGRASASAGRFLPFAGGVVEIGAGGDEFSFDIERPRHRVLLQPFALGTRLVTCGEYRRFIDDGGYRKPELWLSDGWELCQSRGWQAPLYWEGDQLMTLSGLRAIDPDEPVCHVSHYEADAFARWAGARLPLEAEWEQAAPQSISGNFLESGALHPRAGADWFGDVWVWTASPFVPYPGFRPPAGALGEYNAKFASSRMVLRGGSCFTPSRHLRRSYRNFFPPETRWQMSGIRLARRHE